jgi:hypothetical protein
MSSGSTVKASYKYPICPECGRNSIAAFTPPKAGKYAGKKLDDVDWERAHLYCANDANCQFNTRILDLTTPLNEPNNSYALNRETTREVYNVLSGYCGERGKSEGATETLVRIIRERDLLVRREIEKLLG